jgi:deoxyribonuclease IV
MQKLIGGHCLATGGLHRAAEMCASTGGNAMSLFVRNQRRWKSPELTVAQVDVFKESCARANLCTRSAVLPHGSYLINLGCPDVAIREKSRLAALDEMERCERLGMTMYNIHPGSSRGQVDSEQCMVWISNEIDALLDSDSCQSVSVVLENTAGGGNTIGRSFEELAFIVGGVSERNRGRVGACLDTAHMFAAGYDIVGDFDGVMAHFDATVGFERLRGMHLNDSKVPLGSNRDRHERLGADTGHIGLAPFKRIMNDARFDNMPLVLETDVDAYASEIELLRSFQGQS